MAKFNTTGVKPARGAGFVEAESTPSLTTHEGGAGFARTPQSELFLLATGSFFGENAFYENKDERTKRFVDLSRKVAVADPEWFGQFVAWLRGDGNIRTGALVAAVEGADALKVAGIPGGRALVASALKRADEPAEALAYWISEHGRKIPQPVKRGIADAVVATFNQYSLAKYDSPKRGFRAGDVIELVHPSPKGGAQSALFKYALDRRRDSKVEVPSELETLIARNKFLAQDGKTIRGLVDSGEAVEAIKSAGLTWEVLSGILPGGMDSKAWEAVIPAMGYMALLRNLRNFLQAGVSAPTLNGVLARLSDPEEVAKSKQLPMRFLSAYHANKDNLKVAAALEEALNHSLKNVPALDGNTLILVDRSGSMFGSVSQKSGLNFADTAALFGSALAVRAENATLVAFGSTSEEVSFSKTSSILPLMRKFKDLGGTNTVQAIQTHLTSQHTRVIVLTDEQYNGYWYRTSKTPSETVPANIPMFTWNLVGYEAGQSGDTKNRYTFGGLSDASFSQIDLVERGNAGNWPWV